MIEICKEQYEKDFDEMFKLDKKGLMTNIDCYVSNLENTVNNLQEQNERLIRFKYNIPNNKTTSVPTITKSYKKEYENYKSRCEKAIEHIKEHQLIYTSQYEEESNFDNHLLDILNGGDE